jgi:hypothetical protein
LAVTLLAGGGILLFVTVVVMIGSALRIGWAQHRRDVTARWGLLAVVTWIAASVTHNGFYDRWLYIGVGLLAGVWVERSTLSARSDPASRRFGASVQAGPGPDGQRITSAHLR